MFKNKRFVAFYWFGEYVISASLDRAVKMYLSKISDELGKVKQFAQFLFPII